MEFHHARQLHVSEMIESRFLHKDLFDKLAQFARRQATECPGVCATIKSGLSQE